MSVVRAHLPEPVNADVVQLVEYVLAMHEVASSRLAIRSKFAPGCAGT